MTKEEQILWEELKNEHKLPYRKLQKKWTNTPYQIKQVHYLIGREYKSEKFLYSVIYNCCRATWEDWKKTKPELKECIELATTKKIAYVEDSFSAIMADRFHPGQLSAIKFFLQTRAGWNNKVYINNDLDASAEQIQQELKDNQKIILFKQIDE